VVFFTDGMPTVDETNPDKIVKAVAAKNSDNTRIFTFGVGDDVNAAMLDQLADATRAVSTYVRPAEDIEAKVSSLHGKISHPVMTNVKLASTNVKLHEVYPPQLPDLFHGSQLVVIGRFSGQGAAAVKLTGMVGKDQREMVYELTFPPRTEDGKEFVEHLWARRKVGYVLDQIRANGEQKELVEEVTKLAKKYGIATPYTSYLVVPDAPMPVAEAGRSRRVAELPAGGFGVAGGQPGQPPALAGAGGVLPTDPAGRPGGAGGPGASGPVTAAKPPTAADVARSATREAKTEAERAEALGKARGGVQDKVLADELKKLKPEERKGAYADALKKAGDDARVYERAAQNWRDGRGGANQMGQQGVDLAVNANNLRYQSRVSQTANRTANGRNCVEVGGVWIDDKFDAKMKTVLVKAQSEAYFRILEKHPKMKDVYRLGNHVVWVTPSNSVLVIDQSEGQEKLSDEEIEKLFVAAK
jgi:Ca-activated chloride channel family protein